MDPGDLLAVGVLGDTGWSVPGFLAALQVQRQPEARLALVVGDHLIATHALGRLDPLQALEDFPVLFLDAPLFLLPVDCRMVRPLHRRVNVRGLGLPRLGAHQAVQEPLVLGLDVLDAAHRLVTALIAGPLASCRLATPFVELDERPHDGLHVDSILIALLIATTADIDVPDDTSYPSAAAAGWFSSRSRASTSETVAEIPAMRRRQGADVCDVAGAGRG